MNQPTAKLSLHARQRAEEMGIVTKRIKRVVRNPDLRFPGQGGRFFVCRLDEPSFRVLINGHDGLEVITVVPWSYERYQRHPGATPSAHAETA